MRMAVVVDVEEVVVVVRKCSYLLLCCTAKWCWVPRSIGSATEQVGNPGLAVMVLSRAGWAGGPGSGDKLAAIHSR